MAVITDPSPSRTAYIYPGQGSQAVGMGSDLYQTSPAAKAVFDEADEVMGRSLSRLCFEGPEEDLRQTVNAQPALLTSSVATMASIREAAGGGFAPHPRYVAGHSVGEYAALVTAGAIPFSDALGLVQQRGRLMHEAGQVREGSMAAILGLDMSAVEQLCRETGAEIANINCDGQIVISGGKQELVRAIDLSRALGAKKAVPLVVSAAFHSSLMQPAVAAMKEALGATAFRQPDMPIVSNCTAEPLSDAAALPQELANQICSCVKWSQSVEYMVGNGVDTFVEVGPGKVLSGLVRRIAKDANVVSVNDASSVKTFLG
jgi:[acyl-carrier-protein] S-malonyltransferase